MTREIKFRAWDKDLLKVRNVISINFAIPYGETCIELQSIDDGKCDTYSLQTEKPILLQFTGLLDKNGIEIFEGDVVVDKHEFVEQKEIISWGDGEWLSGNLALNSHEFFGNKAESLEMIGSIHELRRDL